MLAEQMPVILVLLALLGYLGWQYTRLQIRLHELMLCLVLCSLASAALLRSFNGTWVAAYPTLIATAGILPATLVFSGFLWGTTWCLNLKVTGARQRLWLILLGCSSIVSLFGFFAAIFYIKWHYETYGVRPEHGFIWLLAVVAAVLTGAAFRMDYRVGQRRRAAAATATLSAPKPNSIA